MAKRNKTQKTAGNAIAYSIIALILIGIVTLAAVNFDKLKLAMSGATLYTYEELQGAYNAGKASNQNLVDEKDNTIENLQNQLDANDAFILALQASIQQQLNEAYAQGLLDGAASVEFDHEAIYNLGYVEGYEDGYADRENNPETPIAYAINYNANRPAGAPEVQGVTTPSAHVTELAKKLNKNNYTISGYIFTGWNTAADGSGQNYADEAVILNLTNVEGSIIQLYAQWHKEVVIIVHENSIFALPFTVPTNMQIQLQKPVNYDPNIIKVFVKNLNTEEIVEIIPSAENYYFTPKFEAYYLVIYRAVVSNVIVGEKVTWHFTVTDNYDYSVINLHFSYLTPRPETAQLNQITVLPKIRIYDTVTNENLRGYTKITIEKTISGVWTDVTNSVLDGYNFTPTTTGQYRISYQAFITAFGLSTQIHTFLVNV